MALWDNPSGADTDLAFFSEGEAQPPQGGAILRLQSWQDPNFSNLLRNLPYDWRRIEAVVVDEPYWNAIGGNDWSNPCYVPSDPRNGKIVATAAQVESAAQAVKAISPSTRYWVNFSEPEVLWMKDAACPVSLNRPYIDVVSLDVYEKPFATGVRPYIDWLCAQRPTRHQQIAIIPGTFFKDPGGSAATAASLLGDFFAYANLLNERCDLPLSPMGITGSSDGCLVWMVVGWPGGSPADKVTTFHGELDPQSALIATAWRGQLKTPALDGMVGFLESVVTSPGLDRGTINGWAIDRKTPSTPPSVDLWIDGQYAGGTRAATRRSDVEWWSGIGDAGFRFKIPDPWWDGQTHQVEVYVVAPSAENWNHVLLNKAGPTPFLLNRTPDSLIGNLEAINIKQACSPSCTITGWGLDRDTLGTPVNIDFWVDGMYWSGTKGDRDRPDVGLIHGSSLAGFEFIIPAQFIDHACHHLDAYLVAPTKETWNHVLLAGRNFCFL